MMFAISGKVKRLCLAMLFGAVIVTPGITSQAQLYVAPPAWSPDGNRVAVVVANTVEVRDATTAQLLYELNGHTDFIPMVVWSPDSRMIATPSADQTVKLWDANDGTLLNTLSGHNDALTAAVWSPDGAQLISWDFETGPNMLVWDVATGTLLEQHDSGTIAAAAFSPDGKKIALANLSGIGTLDSQTFEVLSGSARVACCPNTMYSVAWSPDGSTLATGSINGLVTLWDAETAQIVKQFIANPYHQPDARDIDNPLLSWVRDITFSADGSTVLSVSGDGTVSEWDVTTDELVQQTNIGVLAGATWSPYAGRIAVTTVGNNDTAVDASATDAMLSTVVPFASVASIQTLANACHATDTPEQALPTLNQADQLATFITQLEALPADAIPPACRADLLAMAAAVRATP
jgi:WD40 repeat protein